VSTQPESSAANSTPHRGKNIVLCADGTSNAFGQPSSSNVAKLIEYLNLTDETAQVAAYDQGLGTRSDQFAAILEFQQKLTRRQALHPLSPPNESVWKPWTWRALLNSMTKGSDLDTNVGQLYIKLAALYTPGDAVFLFGFSRGAFTVRALAGLTWRYGIPTTNEPHVATDHFEKAWPLFFNEFPDPSGAKKSIALEFHKEFKQRACPIHFLGLWDTVKSYGGLEPVMLPHLRHNASVNTVRHALALDERRAWFEPTTWGWLDSDRGPCAAAARMDAADIEQIEKQNVAEVWFTGCHADVGGGGGDVGTSDIALRWMLGEAKYAGLNLNENGQQFLSIPRETERPVATDSRGIGWKLIERVPRHSIDNHGVWPVTVAAEPGAMPRDPLKTKRGGKIWVHESVKDMSRFSGVTVETYPTRRS
jgi:uncharacterized protein (DUF2235 family)